MYCPSCGANQSDDRKFCTACGTNLSAISAALAGSLPGDREMWTAAVIAQKRALAGALARAAPGLGMLIGAMFLFEYLPRGVAVWVCFGLVVGGIGSIGRGISQYIVAREELRLVRERERSAQLHPPPPPLPSSPASDEPPGSITDRTTRHLR